jgi:integrase/recombinase XerD
VSRKQVLHVLRRMRSSGDIERRNRALVAFVLLTGAHDGAVASFELRHINFDEGKVHQDARDVKSKFSKTFTTWYFPVGEEALAIVRDWVLYLTKAKLFGASDPLFPKTQVGQGTDLGFKQI